MTPIKRIKQVVECNKNIRACFWNMESESIQKHNVYFMAVIEDGLHPLVGNQGGYFIPATELMDYLGLEMDDDDFNFEDKIEETKKRIQEYTDRVKSREAFRKKLTGEAV